MGHVRLDFIVVEGKNDGTVCQDIELQENDKVQHGRMSCLKIMTVRQKEGEKKWNTYFVRVGDLLKWKPVVSHCFVPNEPFVPDFDE